jgi:hypothetical protein
MISERPDESPRPKKLKPPSEDRRRILSLLGAAAAGMWAVHNAGLGVEAQNRITVIEQEAKKAGDDKAKELREQIPQEFKKSSFQMSDAEVSRKDGYDTQIKRKSDDAARSYKEAKKPLVDHLVSSRDASVFNTLGFMGLGAVSIWFGFRRSEDSSGHLQAEVSIEELSDPVRKGGGRFRPNPLSRRSVVKSVERMLRDNYG